jgi:hypothetical protein
MIQNMRRLSKNIPIGSRIVISFLYGVVRGDGQLNKSCLDIVEVTFDIRYYPLLSVSSEPTTTSQQTIGLGEFVSNLLTSEEQVKAAEEHLTAPSIAQDAPSCLPRSK